MSKVRGLHTVTLRCVGGWVTWLRVRVRAACGLHQRMWGRGLLRSKLLHARMRGGGRRVLPRRRSTGDAPCSTLYTRSFLSFAVFCLLLLSPAAG